MKIDELVNIAGSCGADLTAGIGSVNYIVGFEFSRRSFIDFSETLIARTIEQETQRIRAEALQDAAAYVLANAKIKNSCCAETRASICTLIKGMDQK